MSAPHFQYGILMNLRRCLYTCISRPTSTAAAVVHVQSRNALHRGMLFDGRRCRVHAETRRRGFVWRGVATTSKSASVVNNKNLQQAIADLRHSLQQSSKKHVSYKLVHYAMARTARRLHGDGDVAPTVWIASEQATLLAIIWKLLVSLQRIYNCQTSSGKNAASEPPAKSDYILPQTFYNPNVRPVHGPNVQRLLQHISFCLHDYSASGSEVWSVQHLLSIVRDTAIYLADFPARKQDDVNGVQSAGWNPTTRSIHEPSDEDLLEGSRLELGGAFAEAQRLLVQTLDKLCSNIAQNYGDIGQDNLSLDNDQTLHACISMLDAVVISKTLHAAAVHTALDGIIKHAQYSSTEKTGRVMRTLQHLYAFTDTPTVFEGRLRLSQRSNMDELLKHLHLSGSAPPHAVSVAAVHANTLPTLGGESDSFDAPYRGSGSGMRAYIAYAMLRILRCCDGHNNAEYAQTALTACCEFAFDVFRLFNGDAAASPASMEHVNECIELLQTWSQTATHDVQTAAFQGVNWDALCFALRLQQLPQSTRLLIVDEMQHRLHREHQQASAQLSASDQQLLRTLHDLASSFNKSKLPWHVSKPSTPTKTDNTTVFTGVEHVNPHTHKDAETEGFDEFSGIINSILCNPTASPRSIASLMQGKPGDQPLICPSSIAPFVTRFLAEDTSVGLHNDSNSVQRKAANVLHSAAAVAIAQILQGKTSADDEFSMLTASLKAGLPHRGIFTALAQRIAHTTASTGHLQWSPAQLIDALYCFSVSWTFDKDVLSMLLQQMQKLQQVALVSPSSSNHSNSADAATRAAGPLSAIVTRVMNAFDAPHLDFTVVPNPVWCRGRSSTDDVPYDVYYEPMSSSALSLPALSASGDVTARAKLASIKFGIQHFSSVPRLATHVPCDNTEGGDVHALDDTLVHWNPLQLRSIVAVSHALLTEMLQGNSDLMALQALKHGKSNATDQGSAALNIAVDRLTSYFHSSRKKGSGHATLRAWQTHDASGIRLPLTCGSVAVELLHPYDACTLPSLVAQRVGVNAAPSLRSLWRNAVLLRTGWTPWHVQVPNNVLCAASSLSEADIARLEALQDSKQVLEDAAVAAINTHELLRSLLYPITVALQQHKA